MLSKTELEIVRQVSKGANTKKELATALKKDGSQIYRTLMKLQDKGFIHLHRGSITQSKKTHSQLLFRLINPYDSVISVLSTSGIPILTALLEPRSVTEITKITGYAKSIVYTKIKRAANVGILRKDGSKYLINQKIWSGLSPFLKEYDAYNNLFDKRIPQNSIIYYKDKKQIIFSNKTELDATLTGFSVFTGYGIKLYPLTNYYYLPKKKLSQKEILNHTIRISEKDPSVRHFTFIALFYLKFKPRVKHQIIDNIKKILKGDRIPDYPSLAEIKEKANMYDIKL
ncbi:hypothetical protein K9M79_01845 [Candidatus Woesearchaeota archaeon]|nr:hypothetical protein [Candidatus Woesearchaeota archaeon]